MTPLLVPLLLAFQAQAPAIETFRTGSGIESFRCGDLDAPRAAAQRWNADLAAKDGTIPASTPGFVLESAVVVETDDPWTLAAWVAASGVVADLEPLTGSPGFLRARGSSVRAALALLRALEPRYPEGAVYLDVARPMSLRTLPPDPMFSQQWHLRNTSNAAADVNAEAAWDAGYTGSGAIVGVLEGGWQTNHPDLQANYNATASQSGGSSSHGTSVAGVIGAVAYNGTGVVGLAYDAEVSKQYFGSSTTTANAFGYRNDLNDIKNNSWGPADDGTISYMSSVERNALATAVASGRGGLGEIFAWAAGNGGVEDRVEYDPYASSRYTLAIGAVGDQNNRASYNERGSSMLVVAYSSGNGRGITTTDSGNGYTNGFGGTSSASPLGAAIVALMLDANPDLGWRDVQGVLAHSARMVDPGDSYWGVNAAGHELNNNYGFGVVDAPAAASTAAAWTNYGAEQIADSGVIGVGQAIPDDSTTGILRTWVCPQSFQIETVELILSATHGYVGDLWITLTSPGGTESILAKTRSDSTDNYNSFIFMSRRHWDEDSAGTWEVSVSDRSAGTTGTWTNFQIKIYGNNGSGGPGLTLWTGPLYPGASGSFFLEHGTPSTTSYLYYGFGAGSTFLPGLGVTLGIANAVQGGAPVTTDARGDVAWSLPIPTTGAGRTVLLQAAQPGRTSNIWTTRIN